MRRFDYFLFENFDADIEAKNPANPRNFMGKAADVILSQVADGKIVDANQSMVQRLIAGGVLRCDGKTVGFDCPVFLKRDATILHKEVAEKAAALTDMLVIKCSEFQAAISKIRNGFSAQENLYHVLCGMVFDGYFFDYLCSTDALATSRVHPSGLDYLSVIYEDCPELKTLSDDLLCSYNRLANDKCALQSFGDGQGNRFDFYRFFRLLEQGNPEPKFRQAEQLLLKAFGKADKDALLSQALLLVLNGKCEPDVLRLLECFGYAKDGKLCVPVYRPEHRQYIMEIASIAEQAIGDAIAQALLEIANSADLTAAKHGVNPLEITNELYHILFGSINDELVRRGIVAQPRYLPGEGRYLRCVEIY